MQDIEIKKKNSGKRLNKSVINSIVPGAIIVLLILAGLYILISRNARINQLTVEKENLHFLINTRDSVISDLDGTISEIEQNLTFIKNKRGQLELEQQEGGPSKKERIIDDIALMNTMLEESEKKIEELSNKLASSDIDLKSFRNRIARLTKELDEQNRVIAGLKKDIEERDSQIAEMDEQVAFLQTEVLEMSDSLKNMQGYISESSQKIEELDHELNKAYWAFGTFRELKEHGIVSRDGGVLGILGGSKSIKKDLNEEYFTELDIRNSQIIPLYTKKADVISEHSDSSYQFVYEDDLVAYLEIKDPKEFWKLTKYAVIEVR
jgi:small-conductance mechanosensitive channel